MKTIDLDWLKKHTACKEAVEWFDSKSETNIERLYDLAVADGKTDWIGWTIPRLLSPKNKILYAVFAAEQVLYIFEREYPDEKRPRQALISARKCIDENTKENRSAALLAHLAAKTVARTSAKPEWAAVWAAEIAAEPDAVSAAELADAAARAAEVAGKEMQLKIFAYGLSLFKTQRQKKEAQK